MRCGSRPLPALSRHPLPHAGEGFSFVISTESRRRRVRPSPYGRGGTRARKGVGGEGLGLACPLWQAGYDQRCTKHDYGMIMHDLP